MQDFKQLKVWQKAHLFVLGLYKLSAGFPKDERYGLSNQLRRAAASIAANIAERCGRNSNAELARFLIISMGSASEVEYFLILSKDLNYINQEDFDFHLGRIIEIKKMLTSLHQKVKNK